MPDALRFGLDEASHDALAARVSSVVFCAAMMNMAIGKAEILNWSERGRDTVLSFRREAGADLCVSSSGATFADRGGPWREAAIPPWDSCPGYGGTEIAAEAAIAASDSPAALVRLPSFCCLGAPNPAISTKSSLPRQPGRAHVPRGYALR